MSDPKTTYLELVKPVVGDEDGEDLWGDKLNGNFDILDSKAEAVDATLASLEFVAWDNIASKPDVFPPEDHTHPISEVDELQSELDLKLEDAESDGQQYVREDGAWVPVEIPPMLDAYTKTESDARYVDVAGDSMTGALALPAEGSPNANVLNFGNVQTGLYGSSAQIVLTVNALARMAISTTAITTGLPVVLPGAPTADAHAATKQYVDTRGASVAISDTPPGSPTANSLWWESDTGGMFLYYNDGNTSQWVQVSGTTDAYTKAQSDAKFENNANKGAVNGYAPLDGSAKVPALNLPAYVDDVLEFANLAAFPATGTTGIIYIALDSNKVYRWGGSSYTEIVSSPGSTDAIPEGATNKYYTDERVDDRAAALIRNGTGITWDYDDTVGTLTPTISVGNSSIQGDAVSNSQLANMPANTLKGNNTAGVTDAKDLTTAEVKTLLGYVSAAGDTMTGSLRVPAGSSTTTSLHFGTVGTGFYGAASSVQIAISGTSRFTLSATSLVLGAPIYASNGAVGAPAYAFNNAQTTGMYYVATELDFAVVGVRKLSLKAADITADVPIILPGAPTADLHAATKLYVDTNAGMTQAAADARYEPLDSAYTKAESDGRYEPLDSAYTKAESDSNYVNAGGDTMSGALTAPTMLRPVTAKGTVASGTVTFDATAASVFTITLSGAQTWAFTWGPAYSELAIHAFNVGALVISGLAAVKFLKGDGSTTNLAGTGVTLGTDNHFFFWSFDGGANVYGKVA